MIGIILASHGGIAEGVFQAGKMIYGDVQGVKSVFLRDGVGIESFQENLKTAIAELGILCSNILILCDLQGGSPFNTSLALALQPHRVSSVKVVAGLNLPMYLEILEGRKNMGVDELANYAVECGKMGIMMPVLSQNEEVF